VNTEVEVDTVKFMQIDLENLRPESSFCTRLLGWGLTHLNKSQTWVRKLMLQPTCLLSNYSSWMKLFSK